MRDMMLLLPETGKKIIHRLRLAAGIAVSTGKLTTTIAAQEGDKR
jgi:hypothetical protein